MPNDLDKHGGHDFWKERKKPASKLINYSYSLKILQKSFGFSFQNQLAIVKKVDKVLDKNKV